MMIPTFVGLTTANNGLADQEAMMFLHQTNTCIAQGTSIVTTSVSAAVILKETAQLVAWRLGHATMFQPLQPVSVHVSGERISVQPYCTGRLLGYWFGILLVVTGLLIIARDRSNNACKL